MNSESPNPKQSDNSAQPVVTPKKLNKWVRRGLEVLIIIVIIMGVRAWQQRDIVVGAAPALHGILLDGKPYALPSKPSQPLLVHFWATWCPICRAEQSSIESLAKDNPNMITIAMQSGSSEEVQKYMREQSITFPVVNDADNRISASWGVQAVPASFIIDTNGEIRYVEIGYTTEIGFRLRLWLARFTN